MAHKAQSDTAHPFFVVVNLYNEVPHSNKPGAALEVQGARGRRVRYKETPRGPANPMEKKKKQLHRAHAITSQRTAGYRKVATD
jgi:hypothetical protein